MKSVILLACLLVYLFGCTYPVVLVGPRPEPWPDHIEYWYKAGTTAAQRIQDSIDCKGHANGLPVESKVNLEAAMLPGEEDTEQARGRLFHNLERCMLKKGYQYTGECNMGYQFHRDRPACGAP